MRVVIAGSRTFHNYPLLKNIVQGSGFEITEVVNGGAKGADYCGVLYGTEYNIPIMTFQADWDKYNKAAGVIRNSEMADYADVAIIVMLVYSKGAMNMLFNMRKRNKRYYFVTVKPDENGIEHISTIIMDRITEEDHKNGNLPISTINTQSIKNKNGILRFFQSSN